MPETDLAKAGLPEDSDSSIQILVVTAIFLLVATSPVIYDTFVKSEEGTVGAKSLTWIPAGFSLMMTCLSLEQFHGQNQSAFQQGNLTMSQWETQAGLAMMFCVVLMIPVYTGWIRGSTNLTTVIEKVFGRTLRIAVDIVSLAFIAVNGSFVLYSGGTNLASIIFPNLSEKERLKWEAGFSAFVIILSLVIATTGGTKGVAKSDVFGGCAFFVLAVWVTMQIFADEDVDKSDLNRPTWESKLKLSMYTDKETDFKHGAKNNTDFDNTYDQSSWKYWKSLTEDKKLPPAPTDNEFWPKESGNRKWAPLHPSVFFGTSIINAYYWWFNPAMALRITSTRSPSHARKTIIIVAFLKMITFVFLNVPGLALGSWIKNKKVVPSDTADNDALFNESKFMLSYVLSKLTAGSVVMKGLICGVLGTSVLSSMNSQINAIIEVVVGENGVFDYFAGGSPDLVATKKEAVRRTRKYYVGIFAAIAYFVFSLILKEYSQGDFFATLQELQSVPQVFIFIVTGSAILCIFANGADLKKLKEDSESKRIRRGKAVGIAALVAMLAYLGSQVYLKKAEKHYLFPSGDADSEEGLFPIFNIYAFVIVVAIAGLFVYLNGCSVKPRKVSKVKGTNKGYHRYYVAFGFVCIFGMYLFQQLLFGRPDDDEGAGIIVKFMYLWCGLVIVAITLFVMEDRDEGESMCDSTKFVMEIDNDYISGHEHQAKASAKKLVELVFNVKAVGEPTQVFVHEDSGSTEIKFEAVKGCNPSENISSFLAGFEDQSFVNALRVVRLGSKALWIVENSDDATSGPVGKAPDYEDLGVELFSQPHLGFNDS